MSEENQATYTENGRTIIANEVISIIAGLATSEVPGVASMSSGFMDEITTSLGMKSNKKGVKVEVDGNVASISISVVVEFGVKITEVAENIRSRVIDAVQSMTGLSVQGVNIYIQGINLKKEPPAQNLEE
jgi:uncharacterized alkaline shock family protein YloU